MSLPLSVIIPTKDRAQSLLGTVRSLLDQTRRPDELVVVDQSEIFLDLRPLVAGRLNLRHLHRPDLPGLPAARNCGFLASRGEVVLFLDDDVTVERDFIATLLEAYRAHPELDGLGGVDVGFRPGLAYCLLFALFHRRLFADPRPGLLRRQRRLSGPQPTPALLGCAASYRRRVLAQERFDERLTGYALGEDFEFNYRCSRRFRLALEPALRVRHHRAPQNRLRLGAQARAEVRWYRYFYRKHARGGLDRLAWGGLLVGLGAQALLTSLRLRSSKPWAGFWRALTCPD